MLRKLRKRYQKPSIVKRPDIGYPRPMFLASTPSVSAQSFHIADGIKGIYQTLRIMRQIVTDYRSNLLIRSAAGNLVYLQAPKDAFGEAQKLFEFVRDNIRYTLDILDVETVQTPDKTLQLGYGDCDDQTVLLASLAESIGYRTRFVIAGYNYPDNFEHVYCQICVDGMWMDCDPTESEAFGWAAPDAVAYAVEHV